MKKGKISKLLVAFAATATVFGSSALIACKPKNDNPGPVNPVDEEYVIKVNANSAVTYSVNKEKAKEGEDIVITIESVAAGVSISSVVLNSKTTLTSTDGGRTYAFKMPNRSASVSISCSITGDIVLDGEIIAKFEKDASTGLFVALGVKAEGSAAKSKFNLKIKKGEEMTRCKALDLDDTRSFGDIGFISTSGSEYTFEIANGYTYNFYYDETDSEAPFYVQRVGVDVLPMNTSTLQSLLITSPTIRSEYAVNADDYVGAKIEMKDNEYEDALPYVYEWNLYSDNSSLATITPRYEDDFETMYVYKKVDNEKKVYTTVDNFDKYMGEKLVNDDRYRLDYNGQNGIAARLNIIDGDDYGDRYSINYKKANRNLKTSVGMPNYFIEREIMYAYRVSFDTDDGVCYSDVKIVSTPNEDGSFKVNLNTVKEYDSVKTGGTGEVRQEAYVYECEMSFNKRSEMTSLTYKCTNYSDKQWSYTSHEPMAGTKGVNKKTIKATYTYGAKKTGSPEFDETPYFVNSLDNTQFFNKKNSDTAAKDAGKNIVHINDRLYLSDPVYQTKCALLTNETFYAPATALDYWQYGPVSSSNEAVILRDGTCGSYEMKAIEEGTTKITLGNHIDGYGVEKTLDVEVRAGSLVREYWMDNTDANSDECYAVYAEVQAGGKYKFRVKTTPSDAAIKYHPVSADTSLLKVTSADNAKYIEIDVSGAINIKKMTSVYVTLEGSYLDGGKATQFRYDIIPADVKPTGKWGVDLSGANDTAELRARYGNTSITFTENAYTGEVEKGVTNPLMGYIHDDVYDDKNELVSSDVYRFYYTFANGKLTAYMYEIDMQNPNGWSEKAEDYVLWFYYQADTDRYGVFFAYEEYDSEAGFNVYDEIFGEWGGYSSYDVFAYLPFVRVS